MACYSYSAYPIFLFSFIVTSSFIVANTGNFNKDVDITWGDGRAKILNKGKLLTLSLDKASGSGFESKNEFLYGKFNVQLKLVPNNSAGTVTAYYVTESNNSTSGLIPPPIFTPIQSSGILVTFFYIDGRPIREFKNLESFGIPYPKKQSMRTYASLWNADDWATKGGLVKTDWSQAPFIASFRNFNAKACVWSNGISSCSSNSTTKNTWFSQELDFSSQRKLKWVQQNYMLRSQGPTWDEIDFEFLGNLSGLPYTVHTNVYSQGKGDREQQFHLWFDPTVNFHTYSVLWNPQRIVFSVDGIPIREFKNLEAIGVPFPKNQPMRIYSSLWNADDWATRGGLIKTDWSQAPFTASYRNFKADGSRSWLLQQMDSTNQRRLYWVQKNHMIYNYCTDTKRFPQ
ncbi:hypothetical protein CUMW_111350, partial [Citrus unshiu]